MSSLSLSSHQQNSSILSHVSYPLLSFSLPPLTIPSPCFGRPPLPPPGCLPPTSLPFPHTPSPPPPITPRPAPSCPRLPPPLLLECALWRVTWCLYGQRVSWLFSQSEVRRKSIGGSCVCIYAERLRQTILGCVEGGGSEGIVDYGMYFGQEEMLFGKMPGGFFQHNVLPFALGVCLFLAMLYLWCVCGCLCGFCVCFCFFVFCSIHM